MDNHQRYWESEILSAGPVRLVNLLYQGAIEAVGEARRHLAAGEIQPRSNQILKAWEILGELSRSLNHEQAALHGGGPGSELAFRLTALYEYMQQRVLDANSNQIDAPLAEVEALLVTLSEAWRAVPATAETSLVEADAASNQAAAHPQQSEVATETYSSADRPSRPTSRVPEAAAPPSSAQRSRPNSGYASYSPAGYGQAGYGQAGYDHADDDTGLDSSLSYHPIRAAG